MALTGRSVGCGKADRTWLSMPEPSRDRRTNRPGGTGGRGSVAARSVSRTVVTFKALRLAISPG
jgi:hypothetical protein